MKKMFLLIVASVLLVTLGFGQTPAPSSDSGQVSIKGCLGGVNGNYTLAEDGTGKTLKITSSTVDLTPHLGHDVEVMGQAATVAASSGSSDNGIVVTGVNMISDHCATGTASASAAAATASTPAVADTAPSTTAVMPADTPSAPMMASSSAPESTQHLPDTASPLPLIGLLGLGLLAMGLLIRRSGTN